MKLRSFRRAAFSLCFLSLLVQGFSHQAALNKNSQEHQGIYGDDIYDDPLAELSEKERIALAYEQNAKENANKDYDNQLELEDGSLEEQKRRTRKEWLINQLNHFRTNEKFTTSDAKSDPIPQGETSEDRLALLREEETQQREDEKKKESNINDDHVPKAGDLFEGDIVMTEHLRNHILGKNVKRDGLVDKEKLWPKVGEYVRVPYEVDPKLSDLKKERIKESIQHFIDYTCIRFVPRKPEDVDYVYFFSNKSMCYSSVGKTGGRQKISIGNGCSRKGTVVHEMLHTIGFIHEQSRPDRDKYVQIMWKNIKKKLRHNFQKYPFYFVDSFDVPYDFDSVLEYNNKAFTKNDEDTLIDRADPDKRFGQRIEMSRSNVIQVARLYHCAEPSEEKLRNLKYE